METAKKQYPEKFETFLKKFGLKWIWEYENLLNDKEKLITMTEYFKWLKDNK
jgi:hypothetical protein